MMRARKTGFTLVELVGVMIIIGILAMVALPRFFERSAFESRAFADQTLSILRYAQKTAIAQRRKVCVTFSSSGVVPATVTLTISQAFGGACDVGVGVGLTGPNGSTPYQLLDKTSTNSFSSTAPATYPANFSFNSLGQSSIGQTIQVTGAPNVIIIEQETGYVH